MATTLDSYVMRSTNDGRSINEADGALSASPYPSFVNSSIRPTSVEVETPEKFNVMVKYLYSRVQVNMWMSSTLTQNHLPESTPNSYASPEAQPYGVLLRQQSGLYVSHPYEVSQDLVNAVQKINVEVAFTMATDTTDMILASLTPGQTQLTLHDGTQFQIVDSLAEIARGVASRTKKFQCACVVRREKLILVWHDDIQMIFSHAQDVERKLLALIWGDGIPSMFLMRGPFLTPNAASPAPTLYPGTPSPYRSNTHASGYFPTKSAADVVAEVEAENEFEGEGTDLEKQKNSRESLARPFIFTSAVFVDLAMAPLVVCWG